MAFKAFCIFITTLDETETSFRSTKAYFSQIHYLSININIKYLNIFFLPSSTFPGLLFIVFVLNFKKSSVSGDIDAWVFRKRKINTTIDFRLSSISKIKEKLKRHQQIYT